MEDEKKCRVGGMYEAIYLRGKAPDYYPTDQPCGLVPCKLGKIKQHCPPGDSKTTAKGDNDK